MLTFLTGFIASMAHVVTGPDHLAAVTPLAIDSRKKSWMVGMLWGFGHTLGMLAIGALFILFRSALPFDLISRHSETVIGLLLIGVGSWAILRIYRQHAHGIAAHPHVHTKPFFFAHIHRHDHHDTPMHEHEHHGAISVRQNAFAALSIGVVHGFAGFSHLFALLPSLALPSVLESVIYVVAFAMGTILTMILFSSILGFFAFRLDEHDQKHFLKWFTLLGGVLAIAVGILWIIHPF